MKRVGGFIVALILTYIVGAFFISQGNLASINAILSSSSDIEVSITLADRFNTFIHDLRGLAPLYLIIISIGFLIAFLVTGLIVKYLPQHRLVLYTLAGFAAILTIHILIKSTTGVTGIAATRSGTGLFLQGFAGALGGYLFHLISAPKTSEPRATV